MISGRYFIWLIIGLTLFISAQTGVVLAQTLTYSTTSPEALDAFRRGMEAYDDADLTAAAGFFADAAGDDSSFAMAWYYRALAAPTTEEFLEYLSMAEKFSAGASEPEQLIIESARLANDGETAAVRDSLEKLVSIVPDDARAHYLLGDLYFGQGDWPSSERQFRIVIALDSLFGLAYDKLAYTYAYQEEYRKAIDVLKEYAALNGASPRPYASMGEIYLYMGEYDSSMSSYAQSLKVDPGFVISLVGEGNNLVFTNRYDSARVIFEHILLQAKTAADTNMAYSHAAWSYLYEGKPDRAIEALQAQLEYAQSTNDNYTMINVHRELATVYLEKGDCRRAMLQSDQVRSLATMPGFDPGRADRYLRDANFVDAICYVQLDRQDLADSSLREYREEAEASGGLEQLTEYHALAGIAAYWNQDYTTSIEELQKADPRDPLALFYLGRAYEAHGQREKARQIYERLVNFNRDSERYALIRSAARDRLRH